MKARFATGLMLLVVTGCGLKGPPRPPEGAVPDKPRALEARVREGCVELAWRAPNESEDSLPVRSYQALRSIQEHPADPPAYHLLEETAESTVSDCSLIVGQEALYAVRAVSDGEVSSELSRPVRVRMIPVPPAPVSLRVEPGDDFVELSWSSPAEAPAGAGFNVYRSTDPEVFPSRPVNAEPIRATRYVDAPVERGQTYYYEVRLAVEEEGQALVEGKASSISCLTLIDAAPPEPPLGLTAIHRPDGVFLRWFSNPEPDIAGYLALRRRRGSSDFKTLTPIPIKETEYLDREVEKGVEYEYVIKAVDDATPPNVSATSQVVQVFVAP